MPAAAVIPAPIAYIKVVAVKKLVVELLVIRLSLPTTAWRTIPFELNSCTSLNSLVLKEFTLKKLECFKQATSWNTLAWNNRI